MKVIDAHVHTFLFKEHWSEWAAEAYAKVNVGNFWATGKPMVASDFHSPYEWVIQNMDAAGVDQCFLFGNFQKPHDIIVPLEYLVEAKAAYPDRFYAFVTPDPGQPEKSCEQLEWAVKEKGFTGLKILPTYNYLDPLDVRCRMIYRKASELGVPVVIHTGYGIMRYNQQKWQDPNYLEEIFIENHNINFSLGHTGFHRIGDALALMVRLPNVYGDFAYWHFVPLDFIAHWFVYAKAQGVFNRLMWGTDFHHVDMKADMARYKKIPEYTRKHELEPYITEEDLEMFFGGNALRFLGLQ